MSNSSFRIKQSYESNKVTVTSVAVATRKFLRGVCNCTVDRDVGTADFSLVPWILHVWARICAIAHVSGHGWVSL